MTTEGTTGPAIREMQGQLAKWVGNLLEDWVPARGKSKVVRDPIHDFIWLEPHEVALWDTPLLQRLRHIHQTAFTYLVYPGANHSRLDHSIGVLHVSQRMLDAIKRERNVPPNLEVHVRLAALLHDIGHVIFSHLGEDILEERLQAIIGYPMKQLKREPYHGVRRYFNHTSLGEILAFLILTSEPFVAWWKNRVVPAFPHSTQDFPLESVDFEFVGRMIIGRPNPGEPAWPINIINGSFDADKLDYIMRDCHYSGIRAELDTSRLIHSLTVIDVEQYKDFLGVKGGSINYLEQILLAKLTLYTAVYHHHKVRTLECMFRAFYEKLDEQETSSIFLPASLGQWLDLTEHDFFSKGIEEPLAGTIVRQIRDRELLKRCLILDRTTMEKDSFNALTNIAVELKEVNGLRTLREQIHSELPPELKPDLSRLWVDIPKAPDVDEEAKKCYVALSETEVQVLSDLVPTEGWVASYAVNKLRGHVFYSAPLAPREQVATAAARVLEREYGLRFNPISRIGLKP